MAASPQFPKLPLTWSEHSIFSEDQSLHIRLYTKTNTTSGRILIVVHGQAEQSDRYQHFPHFLDETISALFAVDLPGHGLSKGTRGHIESFADYHKACDFVLAEAQKWNAHRNDTYTLHWFGHSLGGLISLGYALDHEHLPVKSFSVSAPLLALAFPVPVLKKTLAVWTEPLLGHFPMSNELDASSVSRDQSVVTEYSHNKLNHKYASPRFFVRLLEEMKRVSEHPGPFHYNLFGLIPIEDKIVSHTAGLNFLIRIKTIDLKKKVVAPMPGFFHESFNDLGKERAFNALNDFLYSV
jgi:lysophospholipase